MRFATCLLVGFPLNGSLVAQDSDYSEREEMYRRYLDFPKYVKGGKVEPHWMADGNSFWYEEGAPENTVIWKVDPVQNTRKPLIDVQRLRSTLQAELGYEPPYEGVPFGLRAPPASDELQATTSSPEGATA